MSSLSPVSAGATYPLQGYIQGQYRPSENQNLPSVPGATADSFVPTASQSPSASLTDSTGVSTTLPPPSYNSPEYHADASEHRPPEAPPAYDIAITDSPPAYPHEHPPVPGVAQKPQIVYVDINAPDHKWMQQILEKTTLKPEDFLSHGKLGTHLTAVASAFKKGTIGTLAGAGVTGLGTIATMAAILGGASPLTGPVSPLVASMAAVLGSVPVVGGLLAGLVWSKKDTARNKAALAEMKTNLVNSPDKYDAFFRKTKYTSAGKSAEKHNLRTATQLENYLRAGSQKPMLWKIHLPVLPKSKVNLVITTANPYNAKQLLERTGYGNAAKAVGDAVKDTAKKVAQQAVKA